MRSNRISVRRGAFDVEYLEGGDGPPLLLLHGLAGLEWGRFHERLAAGHRVVAPRTPGFGGSTGTEELADLHDLIYFYLDLLDALDVSGLPVVGHSFGGMIAAELAAVQPERFSRVVLVAPLGLWDAAHPVLDIFSASPVELAEAMYFERESEAARAVAAVPEVRTAEIDPSTDEGQAVIDFYLERAKSMSTAAKYLWPIPNKGLDKRLHRVSAPTLLIWGEKDGICPPAYADDFRAALPDARLSMVPEAAHMVQDEQPDAVADLIDAFLSER